MSLMNPMPEIINTLILLEENLSKLLNYMDDGDIPYIDFDPTCINNIPQLIHDINIVREYFQRERVKSELFKLKDGDSVIDDSNITWTKEDRFLHRDNGPSILISDYPLLDGENWKLICRGRGEEPK
jgi:hypothetical protein